MDVLIPLAIYLAVGAVFYVGIKGRWSTVLDVAGAVLWPLTLVGLVAGQLFGSEDESL